VQQQAQAQQPPQQRDSRWLRWQGGVPYVNCNKYEGVPLAEVPRWYVNKMANFQGWNVEEQDRQVLRRWLEEHPDGL
jgi:hypothetical protein